MANTHQLPDPSAELNSIHADLLSHAVLAATWSVPAPPSMTFAPFEVYAYVLAGSPARLTYVYQPPVSLALAGGDGNYWLALHADTSTVVAGWTRRIGSHYLWQAAGTQPANPPGGLVALKAVVTGGVITTIDNLAFPSTWVAVGGGRGQLSYAATLTWSGSVLTAKGVVDAAVHRTLDYAGDAAIAFYTTLNAAGGTNRWALNASGTAPSYLGGTLQVSGGTTLSTLQVNSTLGVAGLATLGASLNVTGNVYATGQVRAVGSLYSDGPATLASTLTVASTLTCAELAVNGSVASGFRASIGGSLYVNQLLGIQTLTPQYALDTPGGIHGGNIASGSFTPGQWSYDLGGISLYAHGKLGIATGATTISFNLHVNGTAGKPGGGSWSDSSDVRLKTDVQPIADALSTLCALRGVRYGWQEPARHGNMTGRYYGMVAQEVQPIVPEWVGYDTEGMLTLGIFGFEALTVEALKAIVARLDALEGAIL